MRGAANLCRLFLAAAVTLTTVAVSPLAYPAYALATDPGAHATAPTGLSRPLQGADGLSDEVGSSTDDSDASSAAESRAAVVAQIVDSTPRLYSGSGPLTITVQVHNTSNMLATNTRLSIYATRRAVDLRTSWSDWVDPGEIHGRRGLRLLVSVALPDMLPGQTANAAVNVNPIDSGQLFRLAGSYGLQAVSTATAASMDSEGAQDMLKAVTDWREHRAGAPSFLTVSDSHLQFSTATPMDPNGQGLTAEVGQALDSATRSVLPVAAKPANVKVVPLTVLRFRSDDLGQPNPSSAASARVADALEQATIYGSNVVIDPALMKVSTSVAPSPSRAWSMARLKLTPDGEPTIESPSTPPAGQASTPQVPALALSPTQEPPARVRPQESASEPQRITTLGTPGAPTSTPIPKSANTVEGPNPSPSQMQAVAAEQDLLTPLIRRFRATPTDRLALLPWGNPSLGALLHDGDKLVNLGNFSVSHAVDFAAHVGGPADSPVVLPVRNGEADIAQSLEVGDANILPVVDSTSLANAAGTPLVELNVAGKSQHALVANALATRLMASASEAEAPKSQTFAARQALVAVAAVPELRSGELLTIPTDSSQLNQVGQTLSDLKSAAGAQVLTLSQAADAARATKQVPAAAWKDDQQTLNLGRLRREPFGARTVSAEASVGVFSSLEEAQVTANALDRPSEMMAPLEESALMKLSRAWDGSTKQWQQSLSPYLMPFKLTSPESVLMIYGDSALPVQVHNTLPWAARVRVRLLSQDPRLQSASQAAVNLPPSTNETVNVKLRGVGSGDIRTQVAVMNHDGRDVGERQDVLVSVRANWENLGLGVIGGMLALVLVFGIAKRVRAGRRGTPQNTN